MHRILTLVSLALFGFFFVSTALAEELVTDVSVINFNNGATYEGMTVPEKIQPVAVAIKETFPDATFGAKDGVLFVGLKLDTTKGEVGSVSWKSDCPVNSMFTYPADLVLADDLRPILVAWTRARHSHLGLEKSEVNRYSQSNGHAEVVLFKSQ
jgi:hypothetical protein